MTLELERTRARLSAVTDELAGANSQVSTFQAQNGQLNSEVTTLQTQLETSNERTSTQLLTLQQELDGERHKSEAAEEDATLALELAKEAQSAKEECEAWLVRSLEEIDLWKGKFNDADCKLKELQEQQRDQDQLMKNVEEAPTQKKSVRFKDDSPPSPVVSDDGYDYEEEGSASEKKREQPPPPPPPPPPPVPSVWSTPQSAKDGPNDANHSPAANMSGINSGIFSPSAAAAATSTPTGAHGTPSKFDIASGRAYLHRHSPGSGGLSPHPRMQASDLLKKSAETRRLLRERLSTPGRHGRQQQYRNSPIIAALIGGNKNIAVDTPQKQHAMSSSSLNGDSFASRQGAACKAVGRAIRDSATRLKLRGKWWGNGENDATLLLTNGSSSANMEEKNPEEEGTVAQLESMVRDYCGGVEGTIVQQREKIDELLAFCDHLEKEVMNVDV